MSTSSFGSALQGRSSKVSNSTKRSVTVSATTTGTRKASTFTTKSALKAADVVPQIFNKLGQNVTPKPLAGITGKSAASLSSGRMSSPSLGSEMSGGITTFFTKDIYITNDLIPDQMMEQTYIGGIPSPFQVSKRTPSIPIEPKEQIKIDFRKSYVQLEESDTFWILDIADTKVTDPQEMGRVSEQNEHYEGVLKKRAGGEEVVHKAIQSMRDPPKNKQTETAEATTAEKSTIASVWLLSNACLAEEEKENQKGAFMERASTIPSEKAFACLKNVKQTLNAIERALNINTYASVIAALKGAVPETTGAEVTYLDSMGDDEEKSGKLKDPGKGTPEKDENASSIDDDIIEDTDPFLNCLISFSISLVRENYVVSSMSWSSENEDLIVIGYTLRNYFPSSSLPKGLLCCWCIKNCEYPEKVFTADFGINCVAFADSYPSMVAAGMWEGLVAVYDVRSSGPSPLVDNSAMPSRPSEAVTMVQWAYTTGASGEKTELLISVSQDGLVTQWDPQKTLKGKLLMALTRVSLGKDRFSENAQSAISELACGFCIDFNKSHPNLYVVGTYVGNIYECSAAFSDHYLHTYFFHKGPVFQVAWSPFLSDVFLSCSADWTVAIWNRNRNAPLMVIHSNLRNAVLDAAVWSPECSTVFVMITESVLEVWDIWESDMDPFLHCESESGAYFTTLVFLPKIHGVAVGNDKGKVTMYSLKNMPSSHKDQNEALQKVLYS